MLLLSAGLSAVDSTDVSGALDHLARALHSSRQRRALRRLSERPEGVGVTKYPPIVIHSHGRSGSTLLLEALERDPDMWTMYEPLKAVRELPWQIIHLEAGRCRDPWQPSPSLEPRCPQRDAMLLSSLLACDTMPLQAVWYQELDLFGMRGQWLATDLGAAFHRDYTKPHLAQDAADKALADRRACLAKRQRAVKTVRLNGQLAALYNVSAALGLQKPLVLHLVRDPHAVYASRKHVGGPSRGGDAAGMHNREVGFWVPNASMGVSGATDWAANLCVATSHDKAAGALHPDHYQLLNFSEFVRAPELVIRGIYARHLHRPVPQPVIDFLRARLPGSASAAPARPGDYDRWGTGARSVDHVESQWKGKLERWEMQGIERACKKNWEARPKMLEQAITLRRKSHANFWRRVKAGRVE